MGEGNSTSKLLNITCADGQQVGNNTALNVSRQITDSLTDQDPGTGEIVPCCRRKDITVDPDLILKGLRVLYEKNR